MAKMRTRSKRKDPTDKQKPFFSNNAAGPLFFGTNAIQRKLSVGKSNDASEKEAESAARKVTTIQKADKKEDDKPVQKAEKKEEEKPVQKAEKKEEEKPVQKAEKKEEDKPVQKADKKEEEKPVQKKEDPRVQKATMSSAMENADSSNVSFEERLMKRKGMGFTLPDDIRKDMEGKFRTSFGEVRIHTDKEAADMCDAIHALAFAHGYDIYFNAGMYNPKAESGRELLAHELAHIVQQNG
jgi:hypothetical protein